MSKFLVTSGSTFTPFTYDELVKPIQQMADAHNAAQDAYDQISLETESLRRYLDQEPDDSRARQLYNDYTQKLAALQNNLWANGYSAQTRRDLSAARTGYASDITRLGSAIKNRQDRSLEYWKTKNAHPDMVMGDDPGKGSLDDYLQNDLYGTDYFSYSGNQFTTEIAAEAKARAAGLLGNPDVIKDPRIKGILFRIRNTGFTNEEVDAAYGAVLAAIGNDPNNINNIDESVFAGLDPGSKILADTLISGLRGTGAVGRVSNEEFGRLLEYGRRGLTAGIGTPKEEHFNDKEYDFAQDMAKFYAQQAAKNPSSSSSSGSGDNDGNSGRLSDVYLDEYTGVDHDKKLRKYDRIFGKEEDRRLMLSKRSGAIHNIAEASSAVYSEDLRREAYEFLGFDIGRDPKKIVSDNFLRGYVNHEGVDYEIYYDPGYVFKGEKGVVFAKTKDGVPKISPDLTRYYKNKRKEYLDSIQYYKEKEPEVYKLAQIDPDRQYELYEDEGLGFDVPLAQFRRAVMQRPENSVKTIPRVEVVPTGVGAGDYTKRFGSILAAPLEKTKNGEKLARTDKAIMRGSKNNANYIHQIDSASMTLDKRAVKNPNDVFKFDGDRITNIGGVFITGDALMNNYIIVRTTTSNKLYAIDIDLFESAELNSKYLEGQTLLTELYSDPLFNTNNRLGARNSVETNILRKASAGIIHILGYDKQLVSRGESSKENINNSSYGD